MEEEFSLIWKALADSTRRAILDLLRDGPRTTGEICALFETSRFAVMKHLAVLEKAGLISVRREGRERWNYLNAAPLQWISERWLKPYEAQWAASILRMKRFVETTGERTDRMSEAIATKDALSWMHIEMDIPIKAAPEQVFDALTHNIAAWWDPDCTYKHGRMVLEPEVGKRFYEDFGNGDAALFGIVSYIEHNKVLEIEGPVGLDRTTVGFIRYELHPQGEITLLKFSHHAFGSLRVNTQERFTEGWRDMLDHRLRSLVENA